MDRCFSFWSGFRSAVLTVSNPSVFLSLSYAGCLIRCCAGWCYPELGNRTHLIAITARCLQYGTRIGLNTVVSTFFSQEIQKPGRQLPLIATISCTAVSLSDVTAALSSLRSSAAALHSSMSWEARRSVTSHSAE